MQQRSSQTSSLSAGSSPSAQSQRLLTRPRRPSSLTTARSASRMLAAARLTAPATAKDTVVISLSKNLSLPNLADYLYCRAHLPVSRDQELDQTSGPAATIPWPPQMSGRAFIYSLYCPVRWCLGSEQSEAPATHSLPTGQLCLLYFAFTDRSELSCEISIGSGMAVKRLSLLWCF